jgi:hypothetical protein
MKQTELRLGNLTSAGVVTEINTDCFYVHDGECSLKNTWFDIQPIPLTEEWLIACGFTKDSDIDYRYYLIHGGLAYDLDDNSIRIDDTWEYGKRMFVHEIQNLYHALTGQELEVDLGDGSR